jgi:hypothetical protein
MTPTSNLASAAADADHAAPAGEEAASFVLNLCSSTTPMALAQSELPELKRFTFFVSRRFEEGRERFRLHMGFFASQAEAEEWLGLVRDIYPGAWAGEAPGKKLRARAAEAAATQARHAVGPQKTAAPVAAAPAAPAVARFVSPQPASTPQVPKFVPTLHPPKAAPVKAPAAAAAVTAAARAVAVPVAKSAPQQPSSRPPAATPAARATAPAARAATQFPATSRPTPAARPSAASAPGAQATLAAPAALAARAPAKAAPMRPAPVKPAAQPPGGTTAQARPLGSAAPNSAPRAAPPASTQAVRKPALATSNVKEVLAALDEPEDATGETRLMPAALDLADTADDASLTDTQVLRFLETRQVDEGAARGPSAPEPEAAAAASGISLLKPDDTGTRRALKEAVSRNEAVSFAVQLQWSVQPVELEKVPPLAIFSAYTLYSVEGSREGRKWYGLRLGFFNDAISAKQVAYYVRSEFASVAVVPVSSQERERATEDQQRFSGVGAPRKRRQSEDNEFKLIDSAPAPAPKAAAGSAAPAQAAPVRKPEKSAGAGKSSVKVGARERRTPQTLEETLEILGANELAIDNGSDASLSDTGVRHLRVEIQKNTPFSRLLERLSERVRKA